MSDSPLAVHVPSYQEFLPKVIAIAPEHNLPAPLVAAVCEQESQWNPWAIRYEPNFYIRYVMPLQEKGFIHTDTEARARAFSWGLMQLMGEVARELGYVGDFAMLCDPPTGLYWGTKHLANKLHDASGEVTKALLFWNGGANPRYADEVMARIPRYEALCTTVGQENN